MIFFPARPPFVAVASGERPVSFFAGPRGRRSIYIPPRGGRPHIPTPPTKQHCPRRPSPTPPAPLVPRRSPSPLAMLALLSPAPFKCGCFCVTSVEPRVPRLSRDSLLTFHASKMSNGLPRVPNVVFGTLRLGTAPFTR